MDNQVNSDLLPVSSQDSFPGYYNRHKGVSTKRILRMYFEEGKNQAEIAKILDITKQSVDYHLKPFKHGLLPKPQLQALREKKSDLFEGAVYQLLSDCVDPGKREKASLNNSAYALKQIHEIFRLETDQSTSNQAHVIGIDQGVRQGLNGLSTLLSASKVEDKTQDIRDSDTSEPGQSLVTEDNEP